MLEAVDLNKKLSKQEYKSKITELENRLGELQRTAKDKKIPLILIFEGWDAAGKGTLINKLLLTLDPRGFTVHPTNPPTDEEKHRPYLWRFWRKGRCFSSRRTDRHLRPELVRPRIGSQGGQTGQAQGLVRSL